MKPIGAEKQTKTKVKKRGLGEGFFWGGGGAIKKQTEGVGGGNKKIVTQKT
jgi:hypothetical protein